MKKLFTLMFLLLTMSVSSTYAEDDVYTVAGNNSELFGTAWDPTNTNNDMVYDSNKGVYTWTKENASLKEGTIEFKIAKNHAWGESYGAADGQNFRKEIPFNDTFTLTITFDPESKAITATFDGEEVVYVVAGSKKIANTTTDWNLNESSKMTVENGVASLTFSDLELAKGVYEFKIVLNSAAL